jgi:hypothetical protein
VEGINHEDHEDHEGSTDLLVIFVVFVVQFFGPKMLKLDLSNAPYWLDILPGVRIKVRPLTTADLILAGRASALCEGEQGEKNLAYSIKAAQRGVIDWTGLGDASGKPIVASEANIALVMNRVPAVYQALDTLYVLPALNGGAEKNGSSRSPTGTSAAARATAKAAARTPAKSALTSSTTPKRTRARSPGK